MNEAHTRRTYNILAVIGQGGCGRVYRANMEGSDGFRKEVAVKLMREEMMGEDALMRFRDEARILGLVRDRAIVSVDPPTRLNGRLAIVMEYIEGASAAALLKSLAFPPTVALELVQEVARVLDKVVKHPGPDGRPLNLLHRDLKPANLQITPGGELKVLDFGIARATFDAREALTTANVAGTIGYMAPERLSGIEAPAGDIYSLGVVLRVLVTRDKVVTHGVFRERGPPVERTAAVEAVLALAAEKSHIEPASRPSAREVEDRCQALRHRFTGITLRTWAEAHVPASSTLEPDDLVGVTLSETIGTLSKAGEVWRPPVRRRPRGRWGAALLFAAGAVAAVVAVVMVIALRPPAARTPPPATYAPPAEPMSAAPQGMLVPDPAATPPLPLAAPVEPALVPVRVSAGAAAPALAKPKARDVPVEAGVDAPVRIVAIPAFAAETVPAAVVMPTPPLATTPSPSWKVTFASVPGGADVYVDGVRLGIAPVLNHELLAGSYTVTMRYPDGRSITRSIQTGDHSPKRYVWDEQGGGTWNSF